MGKRPIKIIFGLAALCALQTLSASSVQAQAQEKQQEWITRIPVERLLPPPPAAGSRTEQAEIAEILRLQAAATPAQMAQAKLDNDIENATIFGVVIGPAWDLKKLPKTKFLMDRIMDVDRVDSSAAKRVYARKRPWLVDAKIKTCAPHAEGAPVDAYPSGHTMMAFQLGGVLASLIPNHARGILKRASDYSDNRILCGFHYRSDVTAGQSYGLVLAVEMMQHPVFRGWFNEARAELKAAGITR